MVEVFVFVIGTTPQIITETIYALSQQDPPIYPNEISVITTAAGRKRVRETLIEKGILSQLVTEYGLPPIELTDESFVTPKHADGTELDDITSGAENELMGDVITSLVKAKTAYNDTRLHCSLAGGRKTMSFYMGAALQLFGRPWDKLYHVLVTPAFESNPAFFYKPKINTNIECNLPNGTVGRLNTDEAEIHLAELPFIRLGSRLSLQERSFRDLVAEGQKEVDTASIQPEVTVNLIERTVHIGKYLVEMVPVQLMMYASFLRCKLDQCAYSDRLYCLDCTGCFPVLSDLSTRPVLEMMAKDYRQIYSGSPLRAEELLAKWPNGIGLETMRQNITKINRTLREQIPEETLLPHFTITNLKRYGGTRYGVRVEKGNIVLE